MPTQAAGRMFELLVAMAVDASQSYSSLAHHKFLSIQEFHKQRECDCYFPPESWTKNNNHFHFCKTDSKQSLLHSLNFNKTKLASVDTLRV